MKPTIVDVARAAGVSIATVSRVVNGNYPVSEETRIKVIGAIEELNFVSGNSCREISQKNTSIIGVVVPSVENMYFPMVITGIENYLKKKGYSMLLTCSKNSKEKEAECVNDLLARNVAGIIIADSDSNNISSVFYDVVSKRVPVVFVNGNVNKTQYLHVSSDEETGAYAALKHLVDYHHRDIAFVRVENSYSYDIKEKVFRKCMKELGNNPDEDIYSVPYGNDVSVIEEVEKKFLEVLPKGRYTAVFCANDLMAIGVMNACKKLKLKIPDDISVIGFDNTLLSKYSDPKLTSVDQNTFQLGFNSAQLLLEKIGSKENYSKRIILSTELIERESVGYKKD